MVIPVTVTLFNKQGLCEALRLLLQKLTHSRRLLHSFKYWRVSEGRATRWLFGAPSSLRAAPFVRARATGANRVLFRDERGLSGLSY